MSSNVMRAIVPYWLRLPPRPALLPLGRRLLPPVGRPDVPSGDRPDLDAAVAWRRAANQAVRRVTGCPARVQEGTGSRPRNRAAHVRSMTPHAAEGGTSLLRLPSLSRVAG